MRVSREETLFQVLKYLSERHRLLIWSSTRENKGIEVSLSHLHPSQRRFDFKRDDSKPFHDLAVWRSEALRFKRDGNMESKKRGGLESSGNQDTTFSHTSRKKFVYLLEEGQGCGGTFGPKRSWHFIALKNFISITDPDSHPFFARTFPSENLSAQQSKRGLREGLTFGCTLRKMKISISSPKDEDHLKQIRPVAERERRGWVG